MSHPLPRLTDPPSGVRISFAGRGNPATGDADGTATIRLHLQIVDRLAAFGVVIVGWLSDPSGQVDRVLLATDDTEAIDVADTAVHLAPDRRDMFRAPPGTAISLGFVTFIADTSAAPQVSVILKLRDGAAHQAPLAMTGDLAQLAELLDQAPLDHALGAVAHILAGSRTGHATPALLERLATRTFERIDRQREYGTARGRSTVECHVDAAIRVGALGIVLKGWLLTDESDEIADIALVSLSGTRATVPRPLPRLGRPDVIQAKAAEIASQDRDCGFVTFVPVPDLDVDDTLWFIEITMRSGAARKAPFACGAEPVPLRGIETVVGLAEDSARDLGDLFARAIAPAAAYFWSKVPHVPAAPTQGVFGQPPRQAVVSIVVPLYGRIDFVRHQLASFSNDPDFRTASGLVELIYVLDDPEKERELVKLSRRLHDIYGVAFRTILLGGNFGYSAANNAGARAASGELLLLLNSDVIPKRPRWLGQLVSQYRALHCGVLGCRLLFEDGSIQHAGMSFSPSTLIPGSWVNDHPGKGLATALDPYRAAGDVAAVTGACLLIDRALFLDVGGLSQEYVIGDFEDSDLCLKIHERGLRVCYTPDVELYHLERQSMRLIGGGGAAWRQSLTLLNMWQHGRRWGGLIPVVAARTAAVGCMVALIATATARAAPPATAPAPAAPGVTVTRIGAPEAVFVWRRDRCETIDTPDTPARAFRDAHGTVHLLASHYVAREMTGPSLDRLRPHCAVAFRSAMARPYEAHMNQEWLASFHTSDGVTVNALVHNEFHGSDTPGVCQVTDGCWWNSITAAVSHDGGFRFHEVDPANRIVAVLPYPYVSDPVPPAGYFSPTNIVARDGYSYALIKATDYRDQQGGSCLIRTADPADPGSWRAWDGSDFSIRFVGPARTTPADAARHVCAPVDGTPLGDIGGLARDETTGAFVEVAEGALADADGRAVCGIWASASHDLVTWADPVLVWSDPVAKTECDIATDMYPSVLDPESGTRNFETFASHPYVYFVRKNPADPPYDRLLMRQRVRIELRMAGAPPAPVATLPDGPATPPNSPATP